LRRDISVSQAASTGSDDIKIEVASATATTEETEQEDRGIEKSFDGDYSSYFNSKFGAFSDWPFIIDYTFKSPAQLDYIVYTPRTDNGTRYGAFNEFNVYVMTNGSSEWTKVAECARGDKNYTPTTIQLEQSYTDVKQVRFEIQSAHNNRISCAEMDFYQTNQNKFDYTTIFTDETCSALREGSTWRLIWLALISKDGTDNPQKLLLEKTEQFFTDLRVQNQFSSMLQKAMGHFQEHKEHLK
jgi:hypothetical protein